MKLASGKRDSETRKENGKEHPTDIHSFSFYINMSRASHWFFARNSNRANAGCFLMASTVAVMRAVSMPLRTLSAFIVVSPFKRCLRQG
jgi:hypothetical protein